MENLSSEQQDILFDIKFNLDFVLLDIQSKHAFDEEDLSLINEQLNSFENSSITEESLKEVFSMYREIVNNVEILINEEEPEKEVDKITLSFLNLGKNIESCLSGFLDNVNESKEELKGFITRINKTKEQVQIEKRKQDIQEYLVFLLNGVKYGIGLTVIHEISTLNLEQVTKIPGQKELLLGVVNLRGEVIPLLDMRIWFNTFNKKAEYSESDIILTLKNSSDKIVGVIVDNVQNTIHIDRKDISLSIPDVDINKEYISGFVALDHQKEEENDFIVLLNSDSLLNLNELFK